MNSMTDTRHNHDSKSDGLPREVLDGLSQGARLRAVADGEIHEQPASDEDRARVDFEIELRKRIAKAMSSDAVAPAELRTRIEQIFAEQREQPSVIRPDHGDTRSRSFWQRHSGLLSAAAVLAICVALVAMSFNRSTPQGGNGTALAGITLPISQIAGFAHRQHESCDPTVEDTMRKFQARSHADAIAFAEDRLGSVPAVIRDHLDALEPEGFRFIGLGGCRVPGTGPSVHALFVHDGSGSLEGCQKVSLFIQADPGEHGLQRTICILNRCARSKRQTLALWQADGFLYYIYTANEDARAAAQRAFGAPEETYEYTP
jgi:hypothetical protein